jgi:AcrR family transcriptional regulator
MALPRKLGRPVDADPIETRRRISEVAMRHFGRYGYAQTTIKSIAEDAGLTSAAVYHYSPSKRALLEDLSSSVIDLGVAPLVAVARKHKTFSRRIEAIFDEMLAIHRRSPELARFTVVFTGDAALYPELRAAHESVVAAYRELCVSLVSDALAAKEISPKLDRQGVTEMLAGTISAITSLLVSRPELRHAHIIDCAKLLFSGQLFEAR